MKTSLNLNQTVRSLPPFAQAEVYDFVAFLQQKYAGKNEPVVREDAVYWSALSENALHAIWDNDEDEVYNELLKR